MEVPIITNGVAKFFGEFDNPTKCWLQFEILNVDCNLGFQVGISTGSGVPQTCILSEIVQNCMFYKIGVSTYIKMLKVTDLLTETSHIGNHLGFCGSSCRWLTFATPLKSLCETKETILDGWTDFNNHSNSNSFLYMLHAFSSTISYS